MDRGTHTNEDLSRLLYDGDRTMTMPAGTTTEELQAAADTFFSPDLTMPDQVPMDRLQLFLAATNRTGQVTTFLNSLAEPNKTMALIEWAKAPNFVPDSALGRAAQTALGLADADYAQAICDAAEYAIDDYGDPKPSLLAQIAKFFVGS